MVRWSPRLAAAASLAIGLFFLFVWAPHPWGWGGFDQYHDLGLLLARGEPFPTTDVPWGYAYFLAPFYALFGDRPWMPLLVQVLLNALLPLLVFAFARIDFDDRVAAVAALLTGVLSFNTVYASTQSSDAICNVLFMAGVLLIARANRAPRPVLYAAAGIVFGIAAQFRPNLILLPPLLALFIIAARRRAAAVAHAAVLLCSAVAMLAPWIVRNYRLTGELIPTSTHGGVQLWYGTLQTGPYLHSRAHNPQSVFETGSFPYTSLDRVPLVITGSTRDCGVGAPTIEYWTDRDGTHRRVAMERANGGEVRADLPPSPAPTTYYYIVDDGRHAGTEAPNVFFLSSDHLGDMDRHGDLLDVFDIVRLIRHHAWNESLEAADRLDRTHDGRVDNADLDRAIDELLRDEAATAPRSVAKVEAGADMARLTLDGESTIGVPRRWNGRITRIAFRGPAAERLLHASVPFAQLSRERHAVAATPCAVDHLAVNAPFYRQEPHSMRRYMALALDNIREDPVAYAASVAYRAVRVFFIEGSDDVHTTQQFAGGSRIYKAAFIVSIGIFAVFLAGIVAAWHRRARFGLALMLIAYIPATLAFVLTNMRYSITVQPLIFVFIACLIATAAEASGVWPRRSAASRALDPAENGTARRP
jgi:hypothetical protein